MRAMLSLVFTALLTVSAIAQSTQLQPYKVVFDLTSQDPLDQQAVLRWVKEISSVNPNAEMEVVMYGRGLDLVVAKDTLLSSSVREALNTRHTTFAVCAIAMIGGRRRKAALLRLSHCSFSRRRVAGPWLRSTSSSMNCIRSSRS